jgi:hypothetical protein
VNDDSAAARACFHLEEKRIIKVMPFTVKRSLLNSNHHLIEFKTLIKRNIKTSRWFNSKFAEIHVSPMSKNLEQGDYRYTKFQIDMLTVRQVSGPLTIISRLMFPIPKSGEHAPPPLYSETL